MGLNQRIVNLIIPIEQIETCLWYIYAPGFRFIMQCIQRVNTQQSGFFLFFFFAIFSLSKIAICQKL